MRGSPYSIMFGYGLDNFVRFPGDEESLLLHDEFNDCESHYLLSNEFFRLQLKRPGLEDVLSKCI
jgi:hypothetical protein